MFRAAKRLISAENKKWADTIAVSAL
jgi:hypothetical protein